MNYLIYRQICLHRNIYLSNELKKTEKNYRNKNLLESFFFLIIRKRPEEEKEEEEYKSKLLFKIFLLNVLCCYNMMKCIKVM